MDYKIIQPPQQLSDYVLFFWFFEGTASTHNPFVHRAFAYPYPEMIFCYNGRFDYRFELSADRTLFPGIYGQTQNFSKVTSNADFGVFGFYLYPHALPQLFSLPASELTNQAADLKTLCGKEGEILEEKIMSAINFDQRVKYVTDFLEARLKNVRTDHSKISSSIKYFSNFGNIKSVRTFADSHFLSIRQFERKFKEFSGFSPKLFLRIKRFNSILNRDFQDKSLAQIAYEAGYYDQSHFIHDFQKFSGYSPKEYFKLETIAANDRGTVEFKI